MPIYTYKAAKQTGEIVTGEHKSDSREDLANFLHQQNLIVVNIEEKIGFNFSKLNEIQIGGISLQERVIFVRQLVTMLDAGLPVAQAMEILIEQTKPGSYRNKLTDVYKDIQSGLPLASSFGKRDVIFNELQISLIDAGEKSGNLIEILKQIALDMQKSSSLQGKIKGALIYPAIIFVAIIVVVIVLVVFMIPAVQNLYHDLGGGELPAVTQALVVVSNFFTNPVGLISTIVIVVASVIGYRSFYASTRGRRLIDALTLKLPVMGNLITKMQVVQMTRLLGLLTKSGIPIIDALKSTSNSLSNVHFKEALADAADEVAKGSPLALPLARHKVIPIIVVRMIATGEETGSLEKILGDLTGFYDEQVEDMTANLTKLMEPLILLIVGGIVGFLAIAVYLPIYSIGNFV